MFKGSINVSRKTQMTSGDRETERERDHLSCVVIKRGERALTYGFIILSASVAADIMSVILSFLGDIASKG